MPSRNGHDPDLLLPWFESPFFDRLLAERGLVGEQAEQARFFAENGYLVLEGAVPPALLARARSEVEPLFDPALDDPRKSGGRFQDAWKEAPAVRELACHAEILALLERLYGRRPIPFQTLTFRVGTEQRAHPDTIHFSSFPPRYLAGVWVALEDVGPDNGSLFYYPGSHKLPLYDFEDLGLRCLNPNRPGALEGETYRDYDQYEELVARLMEAHGLERLDLEAPAGTVLIWSAGLVHGGGAIGRPGSSRWSQVTHYYFEDCLYYAPVLSNRLLGDLYLKRVRDLSTGEVVPHRYRGLELPPIETDQLYKLMLDVEGGGDDDDGSGQGGDDGAGPGDDVLRLVPNYEIKHLRDDNAYLERAVADLKLAQRQLEEAIRDIERSPSHRLGRALTAPLRWLRARLD